MKEISADKFFAHITLHPFHKTGDNDNIGIGLSTFAFLLKYLT